MSANRPAWLRLFFSPSRRLLGVFVIFILLPGAFLGVFALRVLRQEGQFIRQNTRNRLERTAEELGREMDSEFRQWDDVVRQAVLGGTFKKDSFHETIQLAFEQQGTGVFLSASAGGFEAFPRTSLLYAPNKTATPRTLEMESRVRVKFSEAESLEIKRKDYGRALLAYRNLLNSVETGIRPLVLQRIARTLRKAGKPEEAAGTYKEIIRLDPVWFGGLPSDFIARSELCSIAEESGDSAELKAMSLAMYRDLTGGKWFLSRAHYLFYSDSFRSKCLEAQVDGDEFNRLRTMEERKLSLSRAAEVILETPLRVLRSESETFLAFWQTDPFAAIVLSEDFLRSNWWPRILSSREEGLDAVLYAPDGKELFGSPPAEAPPFAVMRDVRIDGMPWLLQIWPKEPAEVYANIRQKQNLSIIILVFVTGLLAFGTYITVRIVRRELEIARMRADFVSTVSHEFRSPLTGIRQLGEMLLDGRAANEEKRRHYYQMIVHESDRLTRLVENILDFSRMEEGRREYRYELLDTSQWLRKLVADYKTEIAADGVTVEVAIPDELPAISADVEQLGSAVHNLLDNAVKYSPDVKTVWIAAEAEDGKVIIVVSDKGVGISESDQKHIFERFYRVDGEISKRVKGAGLGLSLVQHIVKAHGGKVECESRVGEGSTFSIKLPAASVPEGG
ncbi:ATP-binding protein [Acidobacteriota bacterium]